jgi:hypothetical protein
MHHFAAAIPQLISYSSTGATVYALTVFGITRTTPLGAAEICGPILDASGISAVCPEHVNTAIRGIFDARVSRLAEKPGTVVVVASAQVGQDAHCMMLRLPPAVSPRVARNAANPRRRWRGDGRKGLPAGGSKRSRHGGTGDH